MKIISACLLGINCRYNGENRINQKLVELASKEVLIPVCPEQLGGFNTPREQMKIIEGTGSDVLNGKTKIINESGFNVTDKVIRGSLEVLKIVRIFEIKEAIMKTDSPSCGSNVSSEGVTTVMLKRNGIKVFSEKEIYC